MNNKLILTIAVVALTSLVMFPCGLGIGFFLGISSTELGKEIFNEIGVVPGEFANEEEPADVANPQDLEGKLYRLKYPRNWTLDENYSRENEYYLSVDSPGGSYAIFTIYDCKTDTQKNVDNAESHGYEFTSPVRESFETWGKFSGKGVVIKDKWSRNTTEIRIFSHSTDTSGFMVVEYRYSSPMQRVEPGFELIADSFELIEQPPEEP